MSCQGRVDPVTVGRLKMVALRGMQFVYYLVSKISRCECKMSGDQGMSWCNVVVMDAIRGGRIILGWCAQKARKVLQGYVRGFGRFSTLLGWGLRE